jgi:hypothetical protein
VIVGVAVARMVFRIEQIKKQEQQNESSGLGEAALPQLQNRSSQGCRARDLHRPAP